MAKLTRVSQKVFGSTAGISQLGVFGSFAAGSPAYTTDPAVVQSLSNFLDGWYSAVVGQNSPPIQDMNSLCFLYAYQLAYILQQGIPEWDAGTTYYVGSIAQDGAGNSYTSLQNNNLNHALTNTSFWAIKGGAIRTVTTTATVTSTDDLVRADSTAGAFTITLPAVASVAVGKIYTLKRVAGSNPVTIKGNGSELIDGLNTQVLNAIEDFAGMENNGTSWDIISKYITKVPVVSSSSGSFSSSSTSNVQVTNMNINILKLASSSVRLSIQGIGGGAHSSIQNSNTNVGALSGFIIILNVTNSNVVFEAQLSAAMNLPFLSGLDTSVAGLAGTYNYAVYVVSPNSFTISVNNCVLVAQEEG